MSKRPINPESDDSILAAEYALGLLRGTTRDAFDRRLANEPQLVAMVRNWDEQFVSFSDDIEPVEAPRSLEAALEKHLFAEAANRIVFVSVSETFSVRRRANCRIRYCRSRTYSFCSARFCGQRSVKTSGT